MVIIFLLGDNMYYVYMIRCIDNSLYTGITTDINRRFNEHLSGIGAKYTKRHRVIKIESVWFCNDRKEASKLEFHIKKLNKNEKEDIIKLDLDSSKYLLEKVEVKKYKRIDKSCYINYN